MEIKQTYQVGRKTITWRLIHEDTSAPVKVNEKIQGVHGDTDILIVGGYPPGHSGSSGRVYLSSGREFFPHVFGLKWVKEEAENT